MLLMAARKQTTLRQLWWMDVKAQRVWIEITRRESKDIGVDINNRSSEFLRQLQIAKKGDKVLHWNSRLGYFVGVSTIKDSKPIKIGTNKGLKLSGFIQFPEDTITLEQIRSQWKLVKEIHDKHFIYRQSLYFPFIPYGSWKSLRPRQTYIAIAPPELVNLLGSIYMQHSKPGLSKRWESFGLSKGSLPAIAKTRKN